MEGRKSVGLCRNCAVNGGKLFLLMFICLLFIHSRDSSLLGDNTVVETFNHQTLRFYEYRVTRLQRAANVNLRAEQTPKNTTFVQEDETNSCTEESRFDDSSVEQRFDEKCGWWISALERWREALQGSTEGVEHLLAVQERSGTGDRLMGAMTAFYHAVHRGSKLTITWDSIDQIFQPSCRVRDLGESYLTLSGRRTTVFTRNCVPRSTYYSCGIGEFVLISSVYQFAYRVYYIAEHHRDHCPIYNRACMQTRHCQSMNTLYNASLTMAHVIGCPLRLIFRPSTRFLESQVRWFDEGQIHNGTLLELLQVLDRHFIVASHIRLVQVFR